MSATRPEPFRIRYPRVNDTGEAQRVIGYTITCPRCHQRKTARTVHLARVWLYGHDCAGTVD